jgi:hypothetical protein
LSEGGFGVCYPDFARTVFIPMGAKIISGNKIKENLARTALPSVTRILAPV